jgi:mRNA-degrading endonuclease RelE of RelBE toxin-antitoxin system
VHIEATQTFIRLYKKLPDELKNRTKKAIAFLQSNPEHPSLGRKKMAGQKDIYEIRISKNYRLTYQKISDTAYLRKVDTQHFSACNFLRSNML